MSKNNYDSKNIDTMELVYGKGYLSAGGDTEVCLILEDMAAKGSIVLDLGCGLGGASIAMARHLEPDKVIGFDIDETVYTRARSYVAKQSLQHKIELILGSAGPLPFSDNSFDIVYVTAVSCHMQDLPGFFQEVSRVLKPGGRIAGSEWIIKTLNEAFHNYDDMLKSRGLNFYFMDQPAFTHALKYAGFENIQLRNRTEAFTAFSLEGRKRLRNELKSKIIADLGQSGYEAFLEWTDIRYFSLAHGGITQQHFRGYKPH